MKKITLLPSLFFIMFFTISACIPKNDSGNNKNFQTGSPTPSPEKQEKPCVTTGCSAQLCDDEEMFTTCEWREEYTCYKSATCERQTDGQCGWVMTQELQDCLEKNSNKNSTNVPPREPEIFEMGDSTNLLEVSKETPQDTKVQFSGVILAGVTSPLIDFNSTDYQKALSENKNIILYFYANWCPICKKEFPLMQDAFNQLNRNDVVGFRVNYKDDETDTKEKNLAQEYGVLYQHTKVFIQNGQITYKAPDSWDTEKYLNEIENKF